MIVAMLICLAVALLAAGIRIAAPSPPPREDGRQITIRNDRSVVTVRSAGSGNITVSFDPSDLPKGRPVELTPGGDTIAENEVSLPEEFSDPHTPEERRREIAAVLTELGYSVKPRAAGAASPAAGNAAHAGYSDSLPDGEGCDEGTVNPYGVDDDED